MTSSSFIQNEFVARSVCEIQTSNLPIGASNECYSKQFVASSRTENQAGKPIKITTFAECKREEKENWIEESFNFHHI